jgi:hypothetical protein
MRAEGRLPRRRRLERCSFIDSTALRTLLTLKRSVTNGGWLRHDRRRDPHLLCLFELIGLDESLSIVPTLCVVLDHPDRLR